MTAQLARTNVERDEMRYRHERMIGDRDERRRQRLERQREVEAALHGSLTDDERRLWQAFSDAVGRVG